MTCHYLPCGLWLTIRRMRHKIAKSSTKLWCIFVESFWRFFRRVKSVTFQSCIFSVHATDCQSCGRGCLQTGRATESDSNGCQSGPAIAVRRGSGFDKWAKLSTPKLITFFLLTNAKFRPGVPCNPVVLVRLDCRTAVTYSWRVDNDLIRRPARDILQLEMASE